MMTGLNSTASQKTSYPPNTYVSNRGTPFLSRVRIKKCCRDRGLRLHNNAVVLAQREASLSVKDNFDSVRSVAR